ncbi:acyl-CoA thioesterase [Fontimonas sp. SYSU GA230001]|uniref:acyl-CoA thioesterase n=1 Tax=Fontimonas sp. SYSU GA230001 TaxID=3142450 RepID=UPI0032B3BC06
MTRLPHAEVPLTVQFHDCDPLGVVWHGHYARYFEHARSALMDGIDYGYEQMRDSGYAWPVIDLHVRYVKAIRLGQKLRVRAALQEWEHRLKIGYELRDADSGEKLARGHTIQVAVTVPEFEMQLVSPAILAHKLGLAP